MQEKASREFRQTTYDKGLAKDRYLQDVETNTKRIDDQSQQQLDSMKKQMDINDQAMEKM